MSRESKFNFIPETQLGTRRSSPLTVSFNLRTKTLSFSKKSDEVKELVGKYVKFYVDEQKNTLAWRVFTEGDDIKDLKDLHLVKKTMIGKYEAIRIYVPVRAYKALKLKDNAKYVNMPVKKYKPGFLLDEGEYYYISFDK